MADKIRRIEKKDFKEVSDLFIVDGILEEGNTVDELIWTFTDPNNSNKYNAFVAIDDSNTIIGVIGYVMSTYVKGESEFQGVTPMSWKLKSNYKGIAGVSLFKKVAEQRGIGIAIGGTKVALKLFPLFKYHHVFNNYKYSKILHILNYYKILKGKNLIKRIGIIGFLLPNYCQSLFKTTSHNDINLIPYNYSNFVEEKEFKNIIKKKITKNYIDWLLNCPSLKTFAFVINKGNDSLGVCVFYKKKIGNAFTGRIVHLPFLGFDKNLWMNVIEKCLDFLKNEGCCFVSVCGSNDLVEMGIFKSGFTKIKTHYEPVFIKDKHQEMTLINTNNWHMQFSEGDIAFRGL